MICICNLIMVTNKPKCFNQMHSGHELTKKHDACLNDMEPVLQDICMRIVIKFVMILAWTLVSIIFDHYSSKILI